MSNGMPPPAVALVPGFFGFEHQGASTYFADRFAAGLRSVLEARGVVGVPVVSVSTLGIASLAARQQDLLRELTTLETPEPGAQRLGGPRTWHLLGHSTGGVDAAMLLRDRPLASTRGGTTFAEEGWGRWAGLVDRISSVVTIAAPHFGTGLAATPIGRFVSGHPSVGALRDMARASLAVVRRSDLGSRIRFALSAAPRATKMPFFLFEMTLMNELARDLHPDVLGALSSRPVRPATKDRLFSVVTVAPRPPSDHPDKLFREMWRWTHEGSIATGESAPAAHLLNDPRLRLRSQHGIELPPSGNGDNDGVVTTCRQVTGTPIALVIGDHVDVLGRYRRESLIDRKVIDPGLLTSGARFGDDELFGMLARVGETMAAMITSA